jgi:hypothetical protein
MSRDLFNEPVARAIAELKDHFGEEVVAAQPEGQGGARVTIARVPLPPGLNLEQAWAGFVIPYNYDDVQIYGHHFPRELRRSDGSELAGSGISYAGEWQGKASLVVSRDSKRWRKGVDTALLKLLKVLEFLEKRAK